MVQRVSVKIVCPSTSLCFTNAVGHLDGIDPGLQCQGYIVYIHVSFVSFLLQTAISCFDPFHTRPLASVGLKEIAWCLPPPHHNSFLFEVIQSKLCTEVN